MRRWFLLAFVVVALPSTPVRADDWPVPRGPSREPKPFHYDAKILQKTPLAFFDDAPACILYFGSTYLIEPDGTTDSISHEITRLNGRKGIEALGEYRAITFNPAYQKVTLHEARVHKKDGKTVNVQPRHVHLRDQSTDYAVYDPEKQVIISFPNLEVGDVIEVKWTVRGKHPEHGGHAFTRYSFGSDSYPTVLDELRIRLPRDKAFKVSSVGGKLAPTITEDKDHRLYHWAVKNRSPLPQDSDMPSREELRLQVAGSTFGTWEAVGKWKEKLRADCWECTPAIRQVVQDVTRGLKSDEEKARALAYWVRRRIRYLSLGPIRHDYTPHTPAQVLANLFGDCKDQAQLLAVMLREAGLLVYLVTLGVVGDGQILPEVPSPWGTHGILMTRIGGVDHWIDTTATLAGWDFLPANARDRVVYRTNGSTIELARTPKLTWKDNRTEQHTHMSILADGTTVSKRTAVYHGQSALHQRNQWTDTPSGERRRLVLAALQDANSRARLKALTLDENNLADLDAPVRATIEFEVPQQFTGEVSREGSITDSVVWNRLLGYTLDDDRKQPLEFGRPFEAIHQYAVELPAAYRLDSFPRPFHTQSPWGSFEVKVLGDVNDARRLTITYVTRIEKTRVEPSDFPAFRKFHAEVSRHYRTWLTLTPTQDPRDIPLLLRALFLTPKDQATTTRLARLYLDAGKPAQAEKVLALGRFYHPRDLLIWDLSLAAAHDPRQRVQFLERMAKLFPDDLNHAIDLARALAAMGDTKRAEKLLGDLAQKGPAAGRATAQFQLARVYQQAKRPADALQAVLHANKLDAAVLKSATAQLFVGQLLEELRQPQTAREAYQKALKFNADNREVVAALIRLEIAAGNASDVLPLLRRFAASAREDQSGLLQAAEWYLQLGKVDDALDFATQARDLKFSAKAQRMLGLIQLERGDFAKALFHLDRADAEPSVLAGRIKANLGSGKLREAVRWSERAPEPGEGLPALQQLVSQVKVLNRRFEAWMERLEMEPWRGSVEAMVCAEWATRQGKPTAQVEKLLDLSLANNAELGPTFALRGWLAMQTGRVYQAGRDAERAILLSPWEPGGYLLRGLVRAETNASGCAEDLLWAECLGDWRDGTYLHWLAAAQFRAGLKTAALQTRRAAMQLRPDQELLSQDVRELERFLGWAAPMEIVPSKK